MNIYGATKSCPKCGNKTFRDCYEENVAVIANKHIVKVTIGAEAIARTCDNCEFVFLEAPLDSNQLSGVGG